MQAVNSLSIMKTVLFQAETTLGESRDEANVARAHVEEAERALGEARAAEGRAEQALEEAQRQAALEAGKARAAEEQLQRAEAELLSYQFQLDTITLKVRGSEERADNAEEIARRSNARAVELAEAMRVAKEKAAEAERKAADAVTMFRQSANYRRELADATAYAYDLGFQDCKLQVRRVFNLEGVEDLEPDALDDQQPSTPAENSAAPAEP